MLFYLRLLNRDNIIELLNSRLTLFIKKLFYCLLFLNLRLFEKLKFLLTFVKRIFLICVVCVINTICILKIFVNSIIN